ncbi:MAG: hypothetical protein V3S14_08410 [Anaerolineae bacterium]
MVQRLDDVCQGNGIHVIPQGGIIACTIASVRGNVIRNVVPRPTSLSTITVPLSCWTLVRTTSNLTPRPETSVICSALVKEVLQGVGEFGHLMMPHGRGYRLDGMSSAKGGIERIRVARLARARLLQTWDTRLHHCQMLVNVLEEYFQFVGFDFKS